MAINPLNSPWHKPLVTKPVFIHDRILYNRWTAINKHLTTKPKVNESFGCLSIDAGPRIFIAKKTTKMRIKSHLDWVWYTPKSLASAIDTGTVEEYYEIMMQHVNSDPNVWNDHDFEMELKSLYASREGRASLLP
jgi:hypothetical protein